MTMQFGTGGASGGGGDLPSDQATVTDGTTITLSPATGATPAQGVANVTVVDNVATYRLVATRAALTTGATAPVQNSAGAAIATGTITIAANAVSHVRLPATVTGLANGATVTISDAGGGSGDATAVVAAGALGSLTLGGTSAIVAAGNVTLLPATGATPAQGVAARTVADGVETFRLAANRVALTTAATAPVQNSAGAAIGTGTITIAANAISHIRLPATVAGLSNGAVLQVRNSAGADPHPATAVIAAGALTGVNLAPTASIIDDGDSFIAVGGQTINVAVAAGVASMTVESNEPFWQPFTVTVGESDGLFGYYNGELGSLTNEPVDEFTVVSIVHSGGAGDQVNIEIRGPGPLANNGLFNGLFGIDGVTYSAFGVSSGKESGSDWITYISIDDVPAWTVDQQIPIVIIPQ